MGPALLVLKPKIQFHFSSCCPSLLSASTNHNALKPKAANSNSRHSFTNPKILTKNGIYMTKRVSVTYYLDFAWAQF